jgi:hypothetical protein
VVTVTAPAEAPRIPQQLPGRQTVPRIAKFVGTGGAGKIAGKSGRLHEFGIGPDGALFRKLPDQPWHRVDDAARHGPELPLCSCDIQVHAFADQDHRIHLLSYRDGALAHASYASEGKGERLRWRNIGEGLSDDITLAATPDGTPVAFARDRQGTLHGTHLHGAERGKWIELGSGLAGRVAVLPGRRGTEIFAITQDGTPVFATWRAGISRKPQWQPLGKRLPPSRLLRVDPLDLDGDTHIVALTEDRQIWTLAPGGKEAGWTGTWRHHGALDELGSSSPTETTRGNSNKGKRPARSTGRLSAVD